MAVTYHQYPKLAVLLVILGIPSIHSYQVVQQSHQWTCQTFHVSCLQHDTAYDLPVVWPDDDFILSIRVVDRLTQLPNSDLANYLYSNGISPFVHVDERAYHGLSNSQIRNNLAVFTGTAWQIPFHSNFTGQAKATIYSSLYTISMTDDVEFSVSDDVSDTDCFIISSRSMRANSCSQPSLQLDSELVVPPETVIISDLGFFHSPGFSSDAIIVVRRDPLTVLYAPADSTSQNSVGIRFPDFFGFKKQPQNILAAIPVENGILVSTGFGVLHYQFASKQSNATVLAALNASIDLITAPSVEIAPGSSVLATVIALNSTNIWAWNPEISQTFFAIDTTSILGQGLFIIDAFSSPTESNSTIAICRQSNGATVILTRGAADWTVRFHLPLSVRPVSSSTPIIERLILNGSEELVRPSHSFPVVIKRVVPWRHPGRVLFAWGSTLLISRTLGSSWYVMYTGENITSFDSARDGTFAFLTVSNKLYCGHIDSWRIVQVPFSQIDTPNMLSGVLFDGKDSLRLVFAGNGSSADSVVITNSLQDVLQAVYSKDVQDNDLICPYKTLEFTLNGDDITAHDVDEPIFLDYLQHVTITISAELDVSPDIFVLSLAYDNLGYVNVSLRRTDANLLSKSVKYELNISDSGQYYTMSPSGRDLRHTPIRLLPIGATSACTSLGSVVDQAPDSGTIKSIISYDVNVFSGCPPGIEPAINLSQTLGTDTCIDPNTDSTYCFPFAADFQLSVQTTDDISGQTTEYKGPITFTVIGAGMTPSSIVLFNDEDVLAYNSGEKSIWAYTNSDSSSILSTNSTISWQCPIGSPCSKIYPDFPNAPELFLLVQISSRTDPSLMTSYCDNSIQIIIQLQGLPMDAVTMLLIASSTSVLVFCLVALIFAANIKSVRAVKPGRFLSQPIETSQININENLSRNTTK